MHNFLVIEEVCICDLFTAVWRSGNLKNNCELRC